MSLIQRITWFSILLILLVLFAMLLIAPTQRLYVLYREHFRSTRQERLFLSSIGFFVTFAIVQGITHAIRAEVGPFHNVSIGVVHIHHLVWGILLLLFIGYIWLVQFGTGLGSSSRWMSRLTALLYGVGAALTLDEFALWLNLEDVYWTHQGRESIDVVILFGALLSIGLWGRPFFREIIREVGRVLWD
jgi:hypothetical protein